MKVNIKLKLLLSLVLFLFPINVFAQHPCDSPASIPQEATVEINKPMTISFCHPETKFIAFKWYVNGIKDDTVLQPVSGTASLLSGQTQYFLNGWIEVQVGKRVLELIAVNSNNVESGKSNPLSLTVRQVPPLAPTVISVTQ